MEDRLRDEIKKEPAEQAAMEAAPEDPKQGKKQASFVKKRLIAAIVAMSIILVSFGVFLAVRHVRNNRPPELASIRERTIALISASEKVNEILWGEGLPTYPRVYHQYYPRVAFHLNKTGDAYTYSEAPTEYKLYYYTFTDEELGEILAYQYCIKVSDGVYVDVEKGGALTIADKIKYRYAKKTAEPVADAIFTLGAYSYVALPDYVEEEAEFYYTASDDENYDYVRTDAGYIATDEIKKEAEKVYAMSFLTSVYESVFTGIQISENTGGILYARYMDHTDTEGNSFLLKSNKWKSVSVARVYLFETMRMSESRKSNATDVYLDIDTYVPSDPLSIITVTVSLTLENGNWFLNSATY